MAYPPVVVVDENDNEIGSAMVAEVWQKGLYHRVVSIFVVDETGRMLLQLRPPRASLFPGCWDQAAGGHVDEGHTYNQAAALEVTEETGLQNVTLKTLATYRYNTKDDSHIINQFVRVYLARVRHDVVLQPETEEGGSTLQWFTAAELKVLVAKQPEACTAGFLHELREYFPTMLA